MNSKKKTTWNTAAYTLYHKIVIPSSDTQLTEPLKCAHQND